MFNQSIQRVGFACKYMHTDQTLPAKRLKELQAPLSERGTTQQWLKRQSESDQYDRLWEIAQHNAQAVFNLVQYVSGLPAGQRMVRLGSDQLPFYTLAPWSEFWQRTDVRDYCSAAYRRVGDLARETDVRLSMHPGQFTVLGSDRDDVVDRSIEELEYHADIARWMGYGNTFQDFKINIHLAGRRGAAGFRSASARLSPELRNMLTVENDEYASGLDDILELGDQFALVFDTHHHWVHSNEFIHPTDSRFQRVIESWRGVRPAMHYSVSRPEYLAEVDDAELPDRDVLKESGFASTKIRAHSDRYTHTASNDMIAEFWPYADIMAEAKHKNLASTELYQYLMSR